MDSSPSSLYSREYPRRSDSTPTLVALPVGVPGELWLGGVQLADGYVGRPDLTDERFVPDPFRPGGRMYRTGDLAAWRPDGALRYLGRTDDQVKVRGQRVELGEIEAALAGVESVRAVAAGIVEARLVVWFAASSDVDVDEAEAALRQEAADRLPPSFLPQHWVPVDAIPLGPSGKTDRRRLAETAPPSSGPVGEGTAPRDLLEQRVCDVVADVLGLPAVAAGDDFFSLGGDSLLVLRLLAALEAETGVELALSDVFAAPTAAGLAGLVGGDERPAATDQVLTLRAGSGSDRAPLFLLPPAGGLGWCYTGLLRELPGDLPVHTIQAPGLAEGRPEPVADLAALARRQLRVIRDVVGDGPFHVAGWSLGGMAAQAVAALARADGQRVGAVVLLDAYPSEQWRHLADPSEAEALVGILRLGGVEPPDGATLDRAGVARLLREAGSAIAHLPEPVLDGCLAAVVEASRLVRTAPATVLPGDLTLVVAGAPRAEDWLDPAGWAPHVKGEVEVITLPVTHGDLVRRPAVDTVAELLSVRTAAG